MSTATGRPTLLEAARVYIHPRVLGMAFLGFSAGLPLLLVGGTFTAMLRDIGVTLAAIGFLSWVGIAHSIKVLWAPIVDRLPLPVLTRMFGRRRSWMLFAQAMIATGLAIIAFYQPVLMNLQSGLPLPFGGGIPVMDLDQPVDMRALTPIALAAILVAFGSATQDISIDAYRVEAVSRERQGAMAATYVTGYRVALLVAGAGALHIAAIGNWNFAYGAMAVLMAVGIVTTLIIREPSATVDRNTREMEQRVVDYLEGTTHVGFRREFNAFIIGAVICPLADFFKRFGWVALLILLFIGTFRVSDIVMGVMANPFYLDLGFSMQEIANVAAAFGLAMTLTGAALGGLFVARFGIMRLLLFTAFMAPITNLLFSWLALIGPEIWGLVMAIIADNITGGLAISVLIAYMSSLTNTAYTATQYALFSSLMTLPGQFIGGFTGVIAETVDWPWFFVVSAVMGLPAILLALVLARLAHPDQIERPGMDNGVAETKSG